MSNHRFKFHHGAPKQICMSCGHKTMRTYVDTKTGQPCDPEYGACDRLHQCGYHVAPKSEPMDQEKPRYIPTPIKRTHYRTPAEVIYATKDSRGNTLAVWLVRSLGDKAKDALRAYKCGTARFPERPDLNGAMVFWEVDINGEYRTGKVIPYGSDGRRIKDSGSAWTHQITTGQSMEALGCAQCLWGEHLLAERPDAPVAVTESEKSALIASIFHPSHVWVSTGGAQGLSAERCMVLQGRDVTLFPDKGMYQSWSNKATQIGLDVLCNSLVVSDILEAMGEASEGSDIADGLMYADDKGYFNYFEAAGIDLFPDVLTDEARAILDADEEVQVINFDHVPGPLKPIQSPIDRLVASNPAIGKLVETLDLDLSNATVRPYKP